MSEDQSSKQKAIDIYDKLIQKNCKNCGPCGRRLYYDDSGKLIMPSCYYRNDLLPRQRRWQGLDKRKKKVSDYNKLQEQPNNDPILVAFNDLDIKLRTNKPVHMTIREILERDSNQKPKEENDSQ